MAENSKIEWTHHTANLWHGCTKVHEGCDNCYAEAQAKRWGNDIWGNERPRKEIKSVWSDFVKYQKAAEAAGEKHFVFVGSMMDIAEKPMPLIDSKGIQLAEGVTTEDLRQRFFNKVIPASPNLIFLLLSKRPSNYNKYTPEVWKTNPPKNVMFGTSVVNQKTADTLIPQLLEVNGYRFLSCEPQLGEIKFQDRWLFLLNWIIVGGESGHRRRPFNLDWARYTKEQCANYSVPFFFKQIDKVRDKTEGIPSDLQVRQFPNVFFE